MSFLIDTNVVSELARANADRAVVAWSESIEKEHQYLSVLTLGELARGVERLAYRDEARSRALQSWLEGLRESYRDRIISVDEEIAGTWGRLDAKRKLPVVDALLAATALVRRMTLVTRNTRDVSDTGVALLNPWLT